MRSSLRKPVWILLSLVLAVAMLAGCQNQNTPAPAVTKAPAASATASAAPASTPAQEQLAPVTLKLVLFGDKRSETDNVWAKIGEYTKDKLNATFTTAWIPGSDYRDRMIAMAASGDDWDLNFDGDWLSLSQMITNNAYLDVSKLLPQYAPDLFAKYQQTGTLNSVTINGKVSCLPWTMSMNQRPIWQWRKDLADKAGLNYESNSIKTLEDVDVLLTGLRKAYPDKKILEYMDFRGVQPKYELATTSYNFAYSLNDPACKITHMAFTDAFMEEAKWDKKWQDEGIIWKDVATDQHDGNALIASGELITNVSWHEWAFAANNWGDGAVRANSVIYPDKKAANRTPLANVVAINANSKNPERALMFMNLLEVDQGFYDMLQYGIEGTTYVLGSDGSAGYPNGLNSQNSNYMEWGGQWAFWKPQFMRPTTTYPKDFWVEEGKFASLPVNVNAPLTAFFPDPTPVQNELTQMGAVDNQYNNVFRFGLVDDYQKAVEEYRQKLRDAGADKVTAEIQKQIDAYLASKK